jgi:LacI family transcriptional regulator
MTLQEIARRSNVSIATVSRIINRIPTVNPALARRVQKVIEREGYYPNTQARALVSGRSRLFGLIAELTDPGFPDIVQTFGKLAIQDHYGILLSPMIGDPGLLEQAARQMIERRIDGVAILVRASSQFSSTFSLPARCPWSQSTLISLEVSS